MAQECSPACMNSTASEARCKCRCGGRSHGSHANPVPAAADDGTVIAGKPAAAGDAAGTLAEVNRIRDAHSDAVSRSDRKWRRACENAEKTCWDETTRAYDRHNEGVDGANALLQRTVAALQQEHGGQIDPAERESLESKRDAVLATLQKERDDSLRQASRKQSRARAAASDAHAREIERADREYNEAMNAIDPDASAWYAGSDEDPTVRGWREGKVPDGRPLPSHLKHAANLPVGARARPADPVTCRASDSARCYTKLPNGAMVSDTGRPLPNPAGGLWDTGEDIHAEPMLEHTPRVIDGWLDHGDENVDYGVDVRTKSGGWRCITGRTVQGGEVYYETICAEGKSSEGRVTEISASEITAARCHRTSRPA